MALDPEQMRQRRLQRQQQRQQNRRRTLVKLVLAGIALILSAVVILSVSFSNKPPKETSPATNLPTDTTGVPDTVIHLTAAGDLNITEKVIASGGAEYDYTNTFLDVAHLLSNGDITTVNFEGCLVGEPYGTDRSAPPSLATALSRAGVDLVQLANSYSIYKGMDGLGRTINGFHSAGIEPVGVYATSADAKEAKGYTLRTVQGIKIAFVSFTKGMDGMALPPGNDGCVNLLYTDYATDYQTVDEEGITKILSAAAKEKPDITVALLHWGSEYNDTVSVSQEQICQLLQENGVDAIIGTHSHYVQKMVFDPDAGTFVAYSLGDLVGDASRAGSEYSVILDLEITKPAEGEAKITGYSYTPIFISTPKDQPVRVLRIRESIGAYESGYINRVTAEEYEAMKYALTRIEERIKGE